MTAPDRYYRRHRRIQTLTGYHADPDGTMRAGLTEPVQALTTRWYYGLKRRKPHNTYTYQGVWYRHANAPTEVSPDGERYGHTHRLTPIADEWLWDRPQRRDQGRSPGHCAQRTY